LKPLLFAESVNVAILDSDLRPPGKSNSCFLSSASYDVPVTVEGYAVVTYDESVS
jgi:hypothetical protein